MIFIDGDFPSNKGNCKYHCSPTCHPCQVDKDKWHYGCTHKAWWQNRVSNFVPFVECGGVKANCELKQPRCKKMVGHYKGGKLRSIKYTREKLQRLEKELKEFNELLKGEQQ